MSNDAPPYLPLDPPDLPENSRDDELAGIIPLGRRGMNNEIGQELQFQTQQKIIGDNHDDNLDLSGLLNIAGDDESEDPSPPLSPARQDGFPDDFGSFSPPPENLECAQGNPLSHECSDECSLLDLDSISAKSDSPLAPVAVGSSQIVLNDVPAHIERFVVTVARSVDISSSGPLTPAVLDNRKISESSSISLPISDDGNQPKTRRSRKHMSDGERKDVERELNCAASARCRQKKKNEEAQLNEEVGKLREETSEIEESNRDLELEFSSKGGDPKALRNAVARTLWTKDKQVQSEKLEQGIQKIKEKLSSIAEKKEELDEQSTQELKKLSGKKITSSQSTNASAKCRANQDLRMAKLRRDVFNLNMRIEVHKVIQAELEKALGVVEEPVETEVESDNEGPPRLEAQESPKKYFSRDYLLQCHANAYGSPGNSTTTTASTSPPLLDTHGGDDNIWHGQMMGGLTGDEVMTAMELGLDNDGTSNNDEKDPSEGDAESFNVIAYHGEYYTEMKGLSHPRVGENSIGDYDEDDDSGFDSKAMLCTFNEFGGGGPPIGQHSPLSTNNTLHYSGGDYVAGRAPLHPPFYPGNPGVVLAGPGSHVSARNSSHFRQDCQEDMLADTTSPLCATGSAGPTPAFPRTDGSASTSDHVSQYRQEAMLVEATAFHYTNYDPSLTGGFLSPTDQTHAPLVETAGPTPAGPGSHVSAWNSSHFRRDCQQDMLADATAPRYRNYEPLAGGSVMQSPLRTDIAGPILGGSAPSMEFPRRNETFTVYPGANHRDLLDTRHTAGIPPGTTTKAWIGPQYGTSKKKLEEGTVFSSWTSATPRWTSGPQSRLEVGDANALVTTRPSPGGKKRRHYSTNEATSGGKRLGGGSTMAEGTASMTYTLRH